MSYRRKLIHVLSDHMTPVTLPSFWFCPTKQKILQETETNCARVFCRRSVLCCFIEIFMENDHQKGFAIFVRLLHWNVEWKTRMWKWVQYMAGRLYWCAAGSSNDIFIRRFDGCKLIRGLLLPQHRLESIINLIWPYSAMQKPILFPWCRLWQVCEKCACVCVFLCVYPCVCAI